MATVSQQLRESRETWSHHRQARLQAAPGRPPAPRQALDELVSPSRLQRASRIVTSAHELVSPGYQPDRAVRRAARTGQLAQKSLPSFESRLVLLEETARLTMGRASLRGCEMGVRAGLLVGGLASFALAFVPGIFLPIPALGTVVLVSSALVGLAIGSVVRAVGRAKYFARHADEAEGLLQELLILQREVQLAANVYCTGQHLRQLRRIELLQKDIEGGVGHVAWQVLVGVTNVDPKLRTLFRDHLAPTHPDRIGRDHKAPWYKFWTKAPAAAAAAPTPGAAKPSYRPRFLRRQTQ